MCADHRIGRSQQTRKDGMGQCSAAEMAAQIRGIRHPLFCTAAELDYI